MSHTCLLSQLLSDYGWIGLQIDSQDKSSSLHAIGMSSLTLGRTMLSKMIRTGISSLRLGLIKHLARESVAKRNWPKIRLVKKSAD